MRSNTKMKKIGDINMRSNTKMKKIGDIKGNFSSSLNGPFQLDRASGN